MLFSVLIRVVRSIGISSLPLFYPLYRKMSSGLRNFFIFVLTSLDMCLPDQKINLLSACFTRAAALYVVHYKPPRFVTRAIANIFLFTHCFNPCRQVYSFLHVWHTLRNVWVENTCRNNNSTTNNESLTNYDKDMRKRRCLLLVLWLPCFSL